MIVPRPKCEEAKTVQNLIDLSRQELANRVHIIVGPNGQCMCGMYDTMPMGCADILALHFSDVRDATMLQDLGGTAIMVKESHE